MLRHLYRCAVRLHPSSFRRRFGDEMLYIFDQQKGTLSALGVMLDCVFSLLRQWTLRPHIGIEPAVPLLSPAADHIPSFGTLDPFRPRASAIINGTVLSLILFCMTVFAIRYSSIHILNLRIPGIAGNPGPQVGAQTHLQVDVIPTEPEGTQSETIAAASLRTAAVPRRTRGATIWLDPYVGKYISNYPPAKISIQIEGDPLSGDHLSLSLAAAGHPSLALLPVSPSRFVVVGAKNSYADFTADAQGRICCLSFVMNGNAITARRQ
ncbi:MAG: hypothetical protein ABSG72_15280 [Candidatus Sulfotelmatobacter sp.]